MRTWELALTLSPQLTHHNALCPRPTTLANNLHPNPNPTRNPTQPYTTLIQLLHHPQALEKLASLKQTLFLDAIAHPSHDANGADATGSLSRVAAFRALCGRHPRYYKCTCRAPTPRATSLQRLVTRELGLQRLYTRGLLRLAACSDAHTA